MPERPNVGRPRKEITLVEEGLALIEAGRSPEEAAEELTALGRPISASTLRRALARALPSVIPGVVSAGSAETEPRPDLELVRRVLDARHPAARRELDEGLAVHLRGEAEFGAWLERPFPNAVLDEDELVTTRKVLAQLMARMERAGSGREFSGLSEKAINAIGRIDQILRSRPKPQEPDQVLEKLLELDAEAIEKIEEHLPDRIEPKEIRGCQQPPL